MTKKAEPLKPKKLSRFRRAISLLIFYGIFLCITWLYEPLSQRDFILFTVLLISADFFLNVIEKFEWYQDLPTLFQRLIFYVMVIPISSIIVPILDVLIMSSGSIIFELAVIFKNADQQQAP